MENSNKKTGEVSDESLSSGLTALSSKNDTEKRPSTFLKILLCIFIVAALMFWIMAGYELKQLNQAYKKNLLTPHTTFTHHLFPHFLWEASSTPPAISSIEPWMTFDYLNVVFKIPQTYFSEKLNITDIHYPHLSINRLSSENKTDAAILTTKVRDLIQNYLSASTTPKDTGATSTRANLLKK